jgi:hypothetical protein
LAVRPLPSEDASFIGPAQFSKHHIFYYIAVI